MCGPFMLSLFDVPYFSHHSYSTIASPHGGLQLHYSDDLALAAYNGDRTNEITNNVV